MYRTSLTKEWDDLPIMLNTNQLSNLTGYGEQTIRELCHSNMIPFIRFGRAFMFPRDAIQKWLLQTAENNFKRGA